MVVRRVLRRHGRVQRLNGMLSVLKERVRLGLVFEVSYATRRDATRRFRGRYEERRMIQRELRLQIML